RRRTPARLAASDVDLRRPFAGRQWSGHGAARGNGRGTSPAGFRPAREHVSAGQRFELALALAQRLSAAVVSRLLAALPGRGPAGAGDGMIPAFLSCASLAHDGTDRLPALFPFPAGPGMLKSREQFRWRMPQPLSLSLE